MQRPARFICVLLLATALVVPAFAQIPRIEPFTSGLIAPTKIIFTPRGNLLVAEQGNGPNTGRISFIDRATGVARPLISGLPSGISPLGGEGAPSGPSGLALEGNLLFVTIGSGDAAIPGPLPGTEVPSDNPSSPILSSLLVIEARLPLEDIPGGFTLTRSQHDQLKSGQPITFGTGFEQITLRLIADFPDLRFDARPDFPGNFRSSNPFGVAVRGNTAYVVDASWNLIHSVNVTTGAFQTLATFPMLPNPSNIGPPQIEPVPDSIRFDGGQLLVTTLTGFPFPAGAGRIFAVDPSTGAITSRTQGHTSAIDAIPIRTVTGSDAYMVLEFSTNQLAGAPGRLVTVSGGAGQVIAQPLVTPTSMAADLVRGEVFVTQIFTGQVVRVTTVGLIPSAIPPFVIPVVASAPGVGGSQFETTVQLTNPYDFPISGSLVLRTSGGEGDPSLPYALGPHQSMSLNNVMQSFGRTGLGSVDIIPTIGPPPIAAVRVFDSGTGNGFFQQPVSSQNAVFAGQRVILIGPGNTTDFRMNVGVRTFSAGATIRATVYRANGTTGPANSWTLAPNSVMQVSAAEFVGGPLQPNDSILVEVFNGSAIIYGSVIHNATQASSIQIPPAVQ